MEPARRRADRALQVADVLRRQILHGRIRKGLLPPEHELAQDFGVSRNCVREALALLSDQGLVSRIQGIGTIVTTQTLRHGIDDLRGLRETLSSYGEVRNEIRNATVVPAPAAVASRLRLRDGEDVVYLERLRLLDGRPISLDLTYLVADLGINVLQLDLMGEDVFAHLERLAGQALGQAELVIEAEAADQHSASILQTSVGAPVLLLERLTHLADGRPVDLEFIRFRADRIHLQGTALRPTGLA